MMKRKLIALFFLLMMLVPETVLAGTSARLNQKMATRSGPGTKYTEELGTLAQSTSIEVISQVETNGTVWYQVEFAQNGKLYRCYTGKKRVNAVGSVPWENTVYTEDTTITGAKAYYGPGSNYAKRKRDVYKDSAVQVVCVEGEWAQCEYKEKGKWVRSYINVADLANTVAVAVTPPPAPTAAPAAPVSNVLEATNIIDRDNHLCIDYYGNVVDYSGHSEDFALLVGTLPVMQYFDGVPCIRSHTYVYSGPGEFYWQRYISKIGDYAHTGKNDKNLRIYGTEDGWLLIRYPSDSNSGFRYGWVTPQAISSENQARAPKVKFAYLPAITTRYSDATDDPDRSVEYVGTTVTAHVEVTALAFLDESRDWVYCEYWLNHNGWEGKSRGFLPADSLRLLSLTSIR